MPCRPYSVVLLIAFCFAVSGIGFLYFYAIIPVRSLEQLLQGSTRIEIKRMQIDGQQKSIALKDPQVTEFFTRAFRNAKPIWGSSGIRYSATLEFSSGGAINIGFVVDKEGKHVYIHPPIGPLDDPSYYCLDISAPVPISASSLLQELSLSPQR